MLLTWNKSAGEIAHKQVLALPLPRECDIMVESSTQALVWGDGILLTTLPPGKHAVVKITKAHGTAPLRQIMLAWVETTPILHHFVFKQMRTADNIALDVTIQLSLRIQNLALFCAQGVGDKIGYYQHDLKAYLFDALQEGIEGYLVRQTIQSLRGNPQLKEQLELALRNFCRLMLERCGLVILDIQALQCHNPEIEKLLAFGASLTLERHHKEMELQALQEQIPLAEQSAGLRQQQTIAQQLREERLADRKRERNFVLEKKGLEARYVLDKLQLTQHHSLSRLSLDLEIKQESLQQQHQITIARNALKAQLENRFLEVDTDEAILDRKLQGQLHRQKHQATVETEIAQIIAERATENHQHGSLSTKNRQ